MNIDCNCIDKTTRNTIQHVMDLQIKRNREYTEENRAISTPEELRESGIILGLWYNIEEYKEIIRRLNKIKDCPE